MPRLPLCAFVTAATLFVANAPGAPIPQHLMKEPVYYFPTKLGARLEYEEPWRELTLLVTNVSDRGGVKVVSVGRVGRDESVAPLMTMAVTGGGLYRIERGRQKLDTPETWLKLPAHRDLAWEYPTGDPNIAPRPLVWNNVTGFEDVTVPAGTFRCIRVRSQTGSRGVTYWYAPDVGLVKTEAATWTEVLKSYTPGKE